MAQEVLLDYEIRRLKYVRIWTLSIASLYAILHLIMFAMNKYQGVLWAAILHYSLTGVTLFAILVSYFSMSSIYFAIMLLQI